MTTQSEEYFQDGSELARRRPVVPNAVLAVFVLVVCEIMFFGGLVSAYVVDKGGQSWPPPDQPRLPIWTTAFNTLMLLASAWFIYRTGAARQREDAQLAVRRLLTLAICFGTFFVVFQGFEWVRLINYGLTLRSSIYGSFFYLIIGAHALHVVAGLTALVFVRIKIRRHGKAGTATTLEGSKVFWYFVVGLWPVLYVLVYLS